MSGNAIEGFEGFFPGEGKAITLHYSDYRYAWNLQCPGSLGLGIICSESESAALAVGVGDRRRDAERDFGTRS